MNDETTAGAGHLDLPTAIMQMSSVVLGETTSIDAVLQRTTEVAKATIPGVYEVSVTMANGKPKTVASSGDFAVEVDERQYDADTGPCLQALRQGETVLVDNLVAETRWPEYTPGAIELGVGSSLSVPLQTAGTTIGAFNAYSLEPHAFDADAQDTAEKLAAYAAVAVNNASLYFTASSRADQMAEAMRSRAVIEQAKGMLMSARHCDADQAFEILVGLSSTSHRKLRDVAQAVVEEMTKPQ
jgi:GAF domain-containing protein